MNARDCRQITRGRRSDVNGARPWDGHFRTDRELLGMRHYSIAQAEEAGRPGSRLPQLAHRRHGASLSHSSAVE